MLAGAVSVWLLSIADAHNPGHGWQSLKSPTQTFGENPATKPRPGDRKYPEPCRRMVYGQSSWFPLYRELWQKTTRSLRRERSAHWSLCRGNSKGSKQVGVSLDPQERFSTAMSVNTIKWHNRNKETVCWSDYSSLIPRGLRMPKEGRHIVWDLQARGWSRFSGAVNGSRAAISLID